MQLQGKKIAAGINKNRINIILANMNYSPIRFSSVWCLSPRSFHTSVALQKVQAGRYRKTVKGDKPLTYEMANPPHFIGVRKVS